MAGSKIDCYVDCNSPYSYFAVLHLQRNRELLEQHGVAVEFFPVFLGGIMQQSGNKPPWTFDRKARYGAYDGKRAQKYFGVSFKTPPFFPIMSLLPMRSLTYVKANYPQATYEAILVSLWKKLWEQHWDISKPEFMGRLLAEHVSKSDVETILKAAASPEAKAKLNETTKYALDSGAYGCPWFLVANGEGVTEPFFGSDRFAYMWDFLGVPYQDLAIKDKKAVL